MATEAYASAATAAATAASSISSLGAEDVQVVGLWNSATLCVVLTVAAMAVGLLVLKRMATAGSKQAMKQKLSKESVEGAEVEQKTTLAGKEDKAKFVVMDGGMGCLTMDMGVARDPKLWSARGLIDEQYHSIVVGAHRKYIEVGARMITTNNYAVQPVYYRNAFPSDWEKRIMRDTELAARLAVEARRSSATSHPVTILGSLPPLCESHRPDLSQNFIRDEGEEFVKKTYRSIAQALLRGGPVDALVAETMSTWDEARLAIEAVKDLGVPLYVCFQGSLRDHALVNQPDLGLEYARKLLDLKAKGAPIVGFGLNCAPPEDTYTSLALLESSGMMENFKKAGLSVMVYANCNEQKHIEGGYRVERSFITKVRSRDDLSGDKSGGYTDWCRRYVALGATHCGGCCGTMPDHIASISHEAELQQEEEEKLEELSD